ncbi:hypothetical protein [Methanobrevibacter sp.]|nr:hypothetical protein [Methanobrevibacter sp.]
MSVDIYDTSYSRMHLLAQAAKNIVLLWPERLNLQVRVDKLKYNM